MCEKKMEKEEKIVKTIFTCDKCKGPSELDQPLKLA